MTSVEPQLAGGGPHSRPGSPGEAQTHAASPPPPLAAPPVSTLPAFEDAELDAAALSLDEHARLLRADLLGRLLEFKRRAGERQHFAVEAVKAAAAADLAAKGRELGAATAELEHQREVVKRMGGALSRAARWRRNHALGRAAWQAWREQVARQRRLQAGMEKAARHYQEHTLRRGVFEAWRAEAVAGMRAKAKALTASAAQAEQQRQEALANAEQTAQRLAEVEAARAASLEARAELEQGMKRAFMRGVCALNIEAMALMKGGEPGGEPGGSTGKQAAGEQQENSQPQAQVPAAANSSIQQQQRQQQLALAALLQKAAVPAQPVPIQLQPAAAPAQGMPGCSIPAGGPGSHPAWPLQQAGSALAPGPGSSGADYEERLQPKPAVEWPLPLVKMAPTQPVAPAVEPRHGCPASAVRNGYGSQTLRPATAVAAVPCSLPSNVPPHLAAALAGAGRTVAGAGSSARPVTAPPRRQNYALGLAASTAGGAAQQQVSRRSLAGQAAAGQGGQARAVRGGGGDGQAQQQAVQGPAWQR